MSVSPMTGASGKSEVMFSNMWQAHPRNGQMMVRSYISREGATKEGDGETKTEARCGKSICEVGEVP